MESNVISSSVIMYSRNFSSATLSRFKILKEMPIALKLVFFSQLLRDPKSDFCLWHVKNLITLWILFVHCLTMAVNFVVRSHMHTQNIKSVRAGNNPENYFDLIFLDEAFSAIIIVI